MKILFIQSRIDPGMQEHEYDCVVHSLALPKSQIEVINTHKVIPRETDLDGVDAVVLGATGKTCILREPRARLEALARFLLAARKRRIPMLGINYGGHLLTIVFGGAVAHDETRREIGSSKMCRCPAAWDDPIFRHLPETFVAQVAHLDRVDRMPEGAVTLLVSEKGDLEAWSFPGEGIYALEFQPESDKDDLASRLVGYQETYAGAPGDLEYVMLRLRPSPEASRVLPLFLSEVVKKDMAANA